jgi:hypothetical protein
MARELRSCPGIDRVLWMRIRVVDGQPSDGVVHGIRRRRPVQLRVGGDTVRRLLAAGVPAVAESRSA